MRIFIGACLVALLSATYVAWQLSPKDLGQGRTRLVWTSDDSPVRREQIDLFNRRHSEILLTLDPGNLIMEKIIVQSLAGIGPDLYDAAGLYVLDGFVRAGIALDLTDVAAKYGIDPNQTWPSVRDYIKVDGRQYAFPASVYANVMFYNKRIFDKYKVPYPSRDMTWDEFVEIGRKLTRKSPDGRGYECFGVMNVHWYELILQAGGRMFTPDGLKCVLDSPEAVEAIQFYDDLTHKHHIMPTLQEESTMSGEGGWGAGYLKWFGAERLAMIRISRWGLITFRQFENLRGQLGVCHQPYKRRKACLINAKLIAVNRQTRNVDQAMKFLQFLTSEEFNMQVVRSADYLPPVPKYCQGEEYLRDPNHPEENFNDIFVEAVERGVAPEISPFVNPQPALQVVTEQLDLLAGRVKTASEACRDMTVGINRLIYRNLCSYERYREKYRQITGKAFDPDGPEYKPYR